MKNKDNENPGDSEQVNKSNQKQTDKLQTKTGPEPKLGDEHYTDEDGRHYAG